MNQAELILLVVKYWGGIGALVAALFLTFDIDRTDKGARSANIFRTLLIKVPAYNLRLDGTSPLHFQSKALG